MTIEKGKLVGLADAKHQPSFEFLNDGFRYKGLSLRLSNILHNLQRLGNLSLNVLGIVVFSPAAVAKKPDDDKLCAGDTAQYHYQTSQRSVYKLEVAKIDFQSLVNQLGIPLPDPVQAIQKAVASIPEHCDATLIQPGDDHSYGAILHSISHQLVKPSCHISELSLRAGDMPDEKFATCVTTLIGKQTSLWNAANFFAKSFSGTDNTATTRVARAAAPSSSAALEVDSMSTIVWMLIGGIVIGAAMLGASQRLLRSPSRLPAVTTINHDRLEAIGFGVMTIPANFVCPLTHFIMDDPVRIQPEGTVVERGSLDQWFQVSRRRINPLTSLELRADQIIPADDVRLDIERYVEQQETIARQPEERQAPGAHPR
jgi:hypothetical protein